MDSPDWIVFLALIPLFSFVVCLFIDNRKEKLISKVAFGGALAHLFFVVLVTVVWLYSDKAAINIKELVVYQTTNYTFLIDFYFDKVTVVYLWLGAFINVLTLRYSRNYMHLEKGYKRFFSTILFFFFAYNLTALSGNFETLFMGWEMLGISSFLLIGFYRERYLPARNAVRVFSVYRIGDVGILLAMWGSHHFWHTNITFSTLNDAALVHRQLVLHSGIGLFIALAILAAAAVKSAQVPFSSWLPRAMEGPTPSSAIFYGSLSVHFGVFLLLRTQPFWQEQLIVRFCIGGVGLATAVAAYCIANVQATVKPQIAYASIAQIGVMFIEIALGFTNLALIHFASNALFRTYQLLVSPSSVAYLIRDKFYNYTPKKKLPLPYIAKRIKYSLYLLAMKEFYMDFLQSALIFKPFKKLGELLHFITIRNLIYFITPLLLVTFFLRLSETEIPAFFQPMIATFYAAIGFILVMKAFAERFFPRISIVMVAANHLLIAMGVSFYQKLEVSLIFIYLTGILISAVIGYAVLNKLAAVEKENYHLRTYLGHIYEHPRKAHIFFLSALGLMGFPITSSFIGEDVIFSHINEKQVIFAFFFASSYILSGIALIRIYARLFLGPHCKSYHSIANKWA
jgi:NADH:ubiquinone oxidoreductase subunit 5 (subunit L)/multisubunit Na+/H+ antiporter MnhA subunit